MPIPHCPNPQCTQFHSPSKQKWYIHYGYHSTCTFGRVPRFRCKTCRTTFSTQTFSIDYYAKKIVDYMDLVNQLVTASGLIDMSRKLKIRVETIENRFERLARSTLAIHSDLMNLLTMKEDMAADGLESFSYSQFHPNHINIFVGSDSEFIYTQGFANLRRKGRMTKEQKEKRTRMEQEAKADPKAVEKSFRSLTEDMVQKLSEKGVKGKQLFTDEHRAYLRAFSKVAHFSKVFQQQQISSKKPRTRGNHLFPVNYVDRQIRKDLSDHARETVQFARCPSALMARMSVYRFYHNCCIPRRVREARRRNERTHAEQAGVDTEQLKEVIQRHWGKRAFLHKVSLGREEIKTWLCQWRNPGIKMGRYVPKYVLA